MPRKSSPRHHDSAGDTQPAEEEPQYTVGILYVPNASRDPAGALIDIGDAVVSHLNRILTRDDEVDLAAAQARYDEQQAIKKSGGSRRTRRKNLKELKKQNIQAIAPAPLQVSAAILGPGSIAYDSTFGSGPPRIALGHNRDTSQLRVATDLKETSWCLAVSDWSTVNAPSGLRLFTWALRELPALYADYTARLWRRGCRGWWTLLRWPIAALLSPLLLGLQFFVSALGIVLAVSGAALSLIPPVRALIVRYAVRLGTMLGDTPLLLNRPTQYAAMLDRLRADLAWMQKTCSRVVVVAHGPGALLAHELLRADVSKVRLFITVGTAQNTIENMRRGSARNDGVLASVSSLIIVPLLLLTRDPAVVAISISSLPFFTATFVRSQRWREFQLCRSLPLPCTAAGAFQWLDFYDATDPIPNGPLMLRDATPDGLKGVTPQSFTVANSPWLRSSGKAYMRNIDGFLAPLLSTIGQVAEDELGHVLSTGTDRAHQARILGIWRRQTWWMAVAVYTLFSGAILARNRDPLEHLRLGPVADVAEQVAASLTDMVPSWVAMPLISLMRKSSNTFTFGLEALCMIFLGLVALRLLWRAWDREQLRSFYRRNPALSFGPAGWRAVFSGGLLIAAAGSAFLGNAYLVILFTWAILTMLSLFLIFVVYVARMATFASKGPLEVQERIEAWTFGLGVGCFVATGSMAAVGVVDAVFGVYLSAHSWTWSIFSLPTLAGLVFMCVPPVRSKAYGVVSNADSRFLRHLESRGAALR